VRPTKKSPDRRSIHVFDLDDTLIRTAAQVRVLDSNGKQTRVLTPAEFTTHALGEGERYDFRDFGNVAILAKGEPVGYTRAIIEAILRHGTRSDFGILTARGDKRLHAPFLIRLFRGLYGITLRNSLVFNLSDERFLRHKDGQELPEALRGALSERTFSKLTVPERKALVIGQDLAARGYNDISLYDDSRENLEAFKVVHKAFPAVTYRPKFIDPAWRVRLKEFLDSGKERKPLTSGRASALILLEHHSRYGENPEAGLRALQERGAVSLEGGVRLAFADGKYALERRD
jgi:phosphoserine phosphatase